MLWVSHIRIFKFNCALRKYQCCKSLHTQWHSLNHGSLHLCWLAQIVYLHWKEWRIAQWCRKIIPLFPIYLNHCLIWLARNSRFSDLKVLCSISVLELSRIPLTAALFHFCISILLVGPSPMIFPGGHSFHLRSSTSLPMDGEPWEERIKNAMEMPHLP